MIPDEILDISPEDLEQVIEHFGVKGQKWGVRKPRGDRSAFVKKTKKPAGPDVKAMTNEELKAAVSRMQLEKQFRDLSKQTNKGLGAHGSKFAKDVLTEVGKQHAKKVLLAAPGAIASVAMGAYVAKKMVG